MIRYNSDNVFVGYIKQLLHNCNITKFPVWKEGITPVNGYRYIKDGAIYLYTNNTWVKEQDYTPFSNIGWNLVKNLKIDSNNYDTHTHEFLGEYLRFLRDYYNVNLMSLYNCYNGQTLNTFDFSFTTPSVVTVTKKENLLSSKVYHFNIPAGTEINAVRQCIVNFNSITNIVVESGCPTETESGNSFIRQGSNAYLLAGTTKYKIGTGTNRTQYAIKFDGDFNSFGGTCDNIEDLLKAGYITRTRASGEIKTIKTTANDPKYKVYPVPIKYYNKYTIAIECPTTIHMVVANLYNNKVYTTSASEYLYTNTYASYTATRFNEPILYDKIMNLQMSDELVKHFETTYLLILVPFDNNSSVVVLEGDYTQANACELKGTDEAGSLVDYNKTIINFESNETTSHPEAINLVTQNQLLKINSHISYPFADRLIEYLADNAITSLDDTPDNIKRIQKQLAELYPEEMLGYVPGIWEPKYQLMLYSLATNNKATWLLARTDLLGYVDKDIEKKLGNDVDIYGGNE